MDGRTAQANPPSAVLRLGSSRSLTITVGAVVLVRDGEDGSYGAVVSSFVGACVRLTFTPEGKPRKVPTGMVLSTVTSKTELLDPKVVPRFQPPSTVVPRRRKGSQF